MPQFMFYIREREVHVSTRMQSGPPWSGHEHSSISIPKPKRPPTVLSLCLSLVKAFCTNFFVFLFFHPNSITLAWNYGLLNNPPQSFMHASNETKLCSPKCFKFVSALMINFQFKVLSKHFQTILARAAWIIRQSFCVCIRTNIIIMIIKFILRSCFFTSLTQLKIIKMSGKKCCFWLENPNLHLNRWDQSKK